MRRTLYAVVAIFTGFPAYAATAPMNAGPGYAVEIVAHGGGCRKSSPPGQCCHMDHKTGVVHCH